MEKLNKMLLLLGALALGGCASIEPVTNGKMIRGLPADRVSVVVPNAVVGRQQDVRLDLPAATCTPLVANANGIFFKSEKSALVRSWVIVTPRLLDAGIFVPFDSTKPCKPFYVYDGTPVPMHKTDQPMNVTLVDSSTNRRVVLRLE